MLMVYPVACSVSILLRILVNNSLLLLLGSPFASVDFPKKTMQHRLWQNKRWKTPWGGRGFLEIVLLDFESGMNITSIAFYSGLRIPDMNSWYQHAQVNIWNFGFQSWHVFLYAIVLKSAGALSKPNPPPQPVEVMPSCGHWPKQQTLFFYTKIFDKVIWTMPSPYHGFANLLLKHESSLRDMI